MIARTSAVLISFRPPLSQFINSVRILLFHQILKLRDSSHNIVLRGREKPNIIESLFSLKKFYGYFGQMSVR